MAVRLLIDGYNLLHHSQLLGRARGPKWLQLARDRLIRHVAKLLDDSERSRTQFVFDVKRRSSAPPEDAVVEGMLITYAIDHIEADDLIERIIRQHPQPKLLTVVSSDHRLQRSAQARRATSVDSDVWLEQLERRCQESTRLSEVAENKPETAPEQVRQLMQKLGYEPPILPPEKLLRTNAIVTRTDVKPSIAQSKAKRTRVKKSTLEERQRANRLVEGELPTVDPRSLDD